MNYIPEEEAKTKWCPMSRQTAVISSEISIGVTANRDGREHYGVDNVNCLVSGCMMWIWNQYKVGQFGMPILLPKEEWVGRCGLVK